MMRLILSTNNITSENPSFIQENSSNWARSELSKILRKKSLVVQDDFEHSKTLKDSSIEEELQIKPQVSGWSHEDQSDYYVQVIDQIVSPLAEERNQYEITVKMFYLSETNLKTKEYADDAMNMVLRKLDIDYIDLLIVSFPKRPSHKESEENGEISEQEIEEDVAIWASLMPLYKRGILKKLGVADFNCNKLTRFLEKVQIRPQVNQLCVEYCCNVTPSLLKLAKMENIELLTHHDPGNILPKLSFSESLQLDGKDKNLSPRSDQALDCTKKQTSSDWVVKYTAVVRDRGVIENKGYLIAIEMVECK